MSNGTEGRQVTLYLHADRARANLLEQVQEAADEAAISRSEWVWRACEEKLVREGKA